MIAVIVSLLSRVHVLRGWRIGPREIFLVLFIIVVTLIVIFLLGGRFQVSLKVGPIRVLGFKV